MKIKIPKEKIIAKREQYRNDPILFFTECLDCKPEYMWDKMREVCESVRDNRWTSVAAGTGVSKTYTFARLVLHFLYCYCPATVITTAPSYPQVEQLLWREINIAHANAKIPLGGKLTQTELDLQSALPKGSQKKWFAFGFATRPDTMSEHATKMQGIHNENVLILFDEGDGILAPIYEAAERLMTGEGMMRFVVGGNPMRPTGNFVDCIKSSRFHHINISVLDTPNYKEGRDVIPGLSGRKYEEFMRSKWGADSNMYKSAVLGQVPDSAVDSIIPISWYERAEGRRLHVVSSHKKRFLTVDVADGGDDDTVVVVWENKTMTRIERFPGKRADEVYADVWRVCKEEEANTIIYDNDGVGRVLGGLLRGVVDDKIDIIAFDGSGEPLDDEDFFNRRAEAHFLMFKDFRDNVISIFKNNDKMKEEITSVRWGQPKKGRMIVEPKKDLKERIGRSPDDGDNVMMMSGCYDQVKAISEADNMYVCRKTYKAKDWRAA